MCVYLTHFSFLSLSLSPPPFIHAPCINFSISPSSTVTFPKRAFQQIKTDAPITKWPHTTYLINRVVLGFKVRKEIVKTTCLLFRSLSPIHTLKGYFKEGYITALSRLCVHLCLPYTLLNNILSPASASLSTYFSMLIDSVPIHIYKTPLIVFYHWMHESTHRFWNVKHTRMLLTTKIENKNPYARRRRCLIARLCLADSAQHAHVAR